MTTHLIVAAVSAAVSVGITWQLVSGHYLSQLQTERLAYQRSALEASRKAADESARLQKAKDEALAKANKRQQVLARDVAAARSELDRLQDAARSTAIRSADTCPAAAHDTAAIAWVLGRCTGELVDLAAKADGHANDVRTLIEAWPHHVSKP